MKSVYIETSIPSYLTARPSTDIRAAGWQQLTYQWWEDERPKYEIFISELVIAEASQGHPEAAQRRIKSLENIPELTIDQEIGELASSIMAGGGIPVSSEADALHVAVASVHRIDYLLTWNCRHINNASTKPIIRRLCEDAGFICPEICTPLELLS
jgi:predicted nucleic acid-binding protein